MTASTEPSLKPRQLQVARLRKEEEEESWISGEELYTEGSSDDESTIQSRSKSPAPHHKQPQPKTPPHFPLAGQSKKPGTSQKSPSESPPSAASEPATQDDPHLTETTRRLSQMGMDEAAAAKAEEADTVPEPKQQQVEEQEEVMLWRPKRGSIRLPHVELDPPTTRLQEQVSG